MLHKILTGLVVVLFVALLVSCGGVFQTSPGSGGGGGDGDAALAVVNIGDAPADRIISFEITVDSITLTNSSGTTVTVLGTATRVEMIHRSGKFEPVRVLSIPAGTYTSARVQVSAPELVYLNDLGQTVKLEGAALNLSRNTDDVSFSPQLNVTTNPIVLNFDFDVAASVTLNTVNDTASITPEFTVSTATPPTAGDQDDDDGEVEDLVGVVSGVSAPQFTITVEQGTALTFTTDSTTDFEGITGVAGLTNGMVVEVDAVTLANSLLATTVEAKPELANGMELEGLVVSVTRNFSNEVTSFTYVVQRRSCANCGSAPAVGDTITVNVGGGTAFDLDDDISLTGLGFATFTPTSMFPGQHVEVESDTRVANNVAADEVHLEDQGVAGTVATSLPAGTGDRVFTLTLPADSALALLLGTTSLEVTVRAATELDLTPALNSQVRVRGLLFNDAGTFRMVAMRVREPE